MKNSRVLLILMLVFVSSVCFAGSKNFFSQLFKVYKDYETANSVLWLTGDVGAEKRLGKELRMWQRLTSKNESDQAKVTRVKNIFNKLVPHFNSHGMGFTCQVLHDNTINAFVIPGGHVFVYSGIVDFLQNDDELAAVIAHELGHAERRHSLKNFRASSALTALLQRCMKNTKNKELWSALLSKFALMSFSRKQEDEADDVGQNRMALAGFNPWAQASVWQRFLDKYGDSKGVQKFLSSHPTNSARIENAKRNAEKMNYKKPE